MTALATSCRGHDQEEIVGESLWACNMRQETRELAAHSLNVLITGPTGTGKELIARSIHSQSPRRDHPLIPVDCASLVGSLLPSHLFGHERGAFTDAHQESLGCFRAAEGGTLFLDEIGELDVPMQANLLRVLEDRTVIPVGGVRGIPVDVRIVAATNRDLQKEVENGNFREDLYYRLNVGLLQTVPLAQRPEDIPVLVDHFLADMEKHAGLPRKELTPLAIEILSAYHWPGNVRQLRNILERSVVCCHGEKIDEEAILKTLDLDPSRNVESPTRQQTVPPEYAPESSEPAQTIDEACESCSDCQSAECWLSLENLERYHIQKTLAHTFYNQTAAAELLGITPRVLARMIRQLEIDASASRPGRPKGGRHHAEYDIV